MTSQASLQEFAAEYQDKTGCTDQEAITAAYAMAAIFANFKGMTEHSEHFMQQAKESLAKQ